MNIPLSLIGFEGYDEGERLIGLTDATLPDIEFATTDIRIGSRDFRNAKFSDSWEF